MTFNGYYDTWCYLPLLAFVTFGREAEQYLCAAVLRPGNAVASDGTVALLSRLLPLLRCAFPRARFLVRLDSGFATPEVFDFLDACPRLLGGHPKPASMSSWSYCRAVFGWRRGGDRPTVAVRSPRR